MHFETLWNMAESLAKSYTDLDRKEILKLCRSGMDGLVDGTEPQELHEAMGDVLLGLCALSAHFEEKKDIQVNSFLALKDAIERKRAELLDPE